MIPLPVPGSLTCDLCRPNKTWRRKASLHRDALKHLQERHFPQAEAVFQCGGCGANFKSLHTGNRHLRTSCPGIGPPPEASKPTELDQDNNLTLTWPPRPSSCPLCDFVTHASGVTVATSIDHHLARTHGVHMGKRFWRCQYCAVTMSGIETREHRCRGETAGRRARSESQSQRASNAVRPSPPAAPDTTRDSSGSSTRPSDIPARRGTRRLRQQTAPTGGRTRARPERVTNVAHPPPPPTGCLDEPAYQQSPPRRPRSEWGYPD